MTDEIELLKKEYKSRSQEDYISLSSFTVIEESGWLRGSNYEYRNVVVKSESSGKFYHIYGHRTADLFLGPFEYNEPEVTQVYPVEKQRWQKTWLAVMVDGDD